MAPIGVNFALSTAPTIDGNEILADTRRAVEWYQEQEAERQRKENERLDAERETAQRDRERRKSELLGLLADSEVQGILAAMKPAAEVQQQQPITENI